MDEQQGEELAPLLTKPRATEVAYVEDIPSFESMLSILAKDHSPIAIDAERAAGFKYSSRAYLIQIHRRGFPIYLIDPIAIRESDENSFPRLSDSIADAEWIIHAATQDIPCLAELGLKPRKLFDTELAGRLMGLPRVGLGSACESLLGIRLAKEHSAVDWSQRPLKQEWLNYAALDVDVLPDLRDEFLLRLTEAGKLDWATQEFEHLTKFEAKKYDPERWRGVSGLHQIRDRTQLAVLQELWLTREKMAIEKDVSPGRLMPDSSLVRAATADYSAIEDLVSDNQFIGRASRVYKHVWWDAIVRGRANDNPPPLKVRSDAPPHHRSWPQKFPDADRRLKWMRHLLSTLADDRGVPLENLLNPEIIRNIAWNGSEVERVTIVEKLSELGARSWQIELCGEQIVQGLTAAENPDLEIPIPQEAS